MAASIFLKIPDIEGESQQSGYEGWIEVLSASTSMISPTQAEGAGFGGAQSQVSPIPIVCMMGKHTHNLVAAVMKGTPYAEVNLVFLKTTGDTTAQKFVEYKFKAAKITDYHVSHSGGTGTEQFTINSEEYEIEYYSQDGAGDLTSAGKIFHNSKTGVTS